MTAQLTPTHMAVPPPRELDLIDAGRLVGWVDGDVVGFRGFATETEAAHAAWVAYRTLSRRLARRDRDGSRPVPVDTAPLAIAKRGGRDAILASGRAIATLVRPEADVRGDAASFAFEIRVPSPMDEVRMRAMAYLMYLSLRKSGMRWALWTRGRRRESQQSQGEPRVARVDPNDGFTERGEEDAPEPGRRSAPPPKPASDVRSRAAVTPAGVRMTVVATVCVLIALLERATSAPRPVMIPLQAIALAGLAAVAVSEAVRRRRPRQRHSAARPRHAGAADRRHASRPSFDARREGAAQPRTMVAAAAVAVGLALLVLALLLPDRLAIAASTLGLAGLFVVRLLAMSADLRSPRPARTRARWRGARAPVSAARDQRRGRTRTERMRRRSSDDGSVASVSGT
jgi:hypothetical protein